MQHSAENIRQNFWEVAEEIRKEKGWTQQEMSKKAGWKHLQSYSKFLYRKPFGAEIVARLANAFGVSPSVFFDLEARKAARVARMERELAALKGEIGDQNRGGCDG